MSQGQSPEGGRSGRGRRSRPSPEMRQRAEQMAELLDRAAAKPARSRRRAWTSVAGPALGLSALAIGGVGVVLGLDPGAAGQELSLPALHDIPGSETQGPQQDPGRPAPAPGVDATTGIAPLTEGAPRPAALPGSVAAPWQAPARRAPDAGPDAGRPGAPITVAPAAPPTSAAPTRTSRTARPTTTARPSTSPRSGRPDPRPPSTTPPSTTPTRPGGGGLPRSDSRASAPSVPAVVPHPSAHGATPSTSSTHPDRTGTRSGAGSPDHHGR